MTEGLMSEMSGGERTKARIAQILMQAGDADLIILDEPTSHLDIDTVEWLEEYLMNIGSGLLIVSHDRYFMDRVANQIVELEEGVTNQYSGNYTQFVEKKELEYERLKMAAEKYSTEKDRLEKMAEQQHAKLWYKATHKVTLKRIDRMDKVDPPREERDIKMRIESASRGGREAIRAKNVSVELGGKKIIDSLDLDVEVGDKIGIIGPNGCGKTTLLRAIMGEIEHSGELWVAPGAKIGYFAQGHDHLESGHSRRAATVAGPRSGREAQGQEPAGQADDHRVRRQPADQDPFRRGEGQGRLGIAHRGAPEPVGPRRTDQLSGHPIQERGRVGLGRLHRDHGGGHP